MAVISGGVILSGGTESGSGLATPFHWPDAPDSGASGTYVGLAVEGSILIDTSTGNRYVATDATGASTVTWVLIDTAPA